MLSSYLFIVNVFFPSPEVAISGRLVTAKIEIEEKVFEESGYKYHTKGTYFISYLKFFLKGQKREFILSKNVTGNLSDKFHKKIKEALEKSDTVTVWIKKSDIDLYSPPIRQIEANGLNIDTTKPESHVEIFITLVIGIILIAVSLRMKKKRQ